MTITTANASDPRYVRTDFFIARTSFALSGKYGHSDRSSASESRTARTAFDPSLDGDNPNPPN
jgi:hypothetical protein